MMNHFFKITFVSLSLSALFTNETKAQKNASYFPLNNVQLLPSEFQLAQEKDKAYILELSADRLVAPYLKEAGIHTDFPYYGNWESTGLGGHIGGHYVTSLSIMYAATKDKAVLAKLDYILQLWKKAQDANGNGYLGGVPDGNQLWKEIHNGNIKADAFSLNGRWVPLYNIHKTFAGLRDAYLYAGNPLAKSMFLKMCDWAVSTFGTLSDAQIQEMLKSEHGGLNEIFIDAYSISKNKAYADLAIKFSHKTILDPLLQKKDALTGLHANTQIPKVIGFEKIGEQLHQENWENAGTFFWDEVVNKRSVAFGGNSTYEHFNPINDFSGMLDGVQGPETCNSNNMLKLTQDIYTHDVKSSYMDYYENVLYNHILSSQDRQTGGLVYFTPIRPDAYRVYSQPETSFWCCVGSGMENHGKYGEMIYAKTEEGLIVNLFIPSILHWKEKGIELTQKTNFPNENQTQLQLHLKENKNFTLYIRRPNWLNANNLTIAINGKKQTFSANENGYITIKRLWKNNDEIHILLPMQLESEQLPDKSPFYAFKYGPILLASETDTSKQTGLFADDSRGGHIASGPMTDFSDIPVVHSNDNLDKEIKKNSDKNLNFSLSAYNNSDQLQSYHLQPFYKIDASRYIMYWPVAKNTDVAKFRQIELKNKDEKLAIEKQTVDVIYCGEQQSELDHFIKYTNATTGTWENYHFRTIETPISYKLKKLNAAKTLYLVFAGIENKASLNLKLGNLNQSVRLEASKEKQVIKIQLPENRNDSDDLLELKPIDNPAELKLIEVRLLK